MPMPDGQNDIFIDLDVAFELVIERLFPASDKEAIIADDTSAEFLEAKQMITRVIGSGEVATSFTSLDHRNTFPLRPDDIEHPAYYVDPVGNEVAHRHDGPGRCRFHREQLLAFLPKESVTSSVAAKYECKKQLVNWFKVHHRTVPAKKNLLAHMQKEIPGLSGRQFDAARREAIEETGRHDLSRAGRKKSNRNTN